MNLDLLNRMKKSGQLPSLPAVAVKVLELARRPDARMNDLAKIISNDPALAAKVLQTINSSFYGLSNQVSTISHALVLLGLQSVKTLALGFSLAGAVNKDKSSTFDYTRFWRQSLYSAVAARTLAKAVLTTQFEEAFLAALLSDIGTLIMHRVIGAEYDALLEASAGNQIELVRLSREKFDLDHAQVGGMLAEHWHLPPLLVESIRQHHDLDSAKTQKLVEIVYTGVVCGQVFAAAIPGLLDRARNELQTRFHLSEAQIQHLFSEIESQSVQLAELFDGSIEMGRSYQQIENEARQTLVELTLQTQIQSRQIEQENHALQQQVTTDGLTGLANRAKWDSFIADAFSHAAVCGKPLAVLFIDLDRFKSINDTYGHQIGDVVLQRVGDLLRKSIRASDLAARYGGEEMAVALCGADRAAGLRVAEQVRRSIMLERICVEDHIVPVTASIGVSAMDERSTYASAADLVGAADAAVYAAKAAGRNRVHAADPGSSPNLAEQKLDH